MAITVTSLTSGTSGTAGPAYPTASITPTANALVLAWVQSRSSAGPVAPTLAGNGLTWVQVATQAFATNQRITLYRAMGAAPSAGTVTITHSGGGTMFGCGWVIAQFTGVPTTGSDGAGAVVQSATNFANTLVNTLTVTLPGALGAGSVGAAGFALNFSAASSGYTPGTGWTLLAHVNNAATIQVAHQTNTTGDTTADHTTTGNGTRAGIAVEVAAAGGPAASLAGTAALTVVAVGTLSMVGPGASLAGVATLAMTAVGLLTTTAPLPPLAPPQAAPIVPQNVASRTSMRVVGVWRPR